MKADSNVEKLKGQVQKQPGSTKAPGRAPGTAAGAAGAPARVYQLSRMTNADLVALAQRHNKQLGIAGDVLAPVLRGVTEAATFRPPAVHPFTVGGAPRKDEYTSAWKSLSKRIGVPLFAPGDTAIAAGAGLANGNSNGGAAQGRAGRPLGAAPEIRPTAIGAVAAAAPVAPTHAQMYGTTEQPPQQAQFQENLAAWLGVGPIDLPLLAPGAPPLGLRKLFFEVHQESKVAGKAGGGGGGSVSWPAVALKLQGDEELADLLKQVYDAYLLPLVRRLPPGTRPARAEAWMQEDIRRRNALAAEQVAPTAEQVAARLQTARLAILAYAPPPPSSSPPRPVQPSQEQEQPQPQQPASVSSAPAPALAPGPTSDGSGRSDTASGQQAADQSGAADPPVQAAGTTVAGATAPAEVAGAASAPRNAAVKSEATAGAEAAGPSSAAVAAPEDATGAAVAAASPAVANGEGATGGGAAAVAVAAEPFGKEALRVLRTAAVAAATYLPAPPSSSGSSKRARSGSRARRGSRAASQKRPRAAGGEAEGGEEGSAVGAAAAGGGSEAGEAAWAAGAGAAAGAVSDLTDPKAGAFLSVIASLRDLRAGPPGCASHPPDLKANFLERWEAECTARAAAAAAAEAAAAAAASIPAGAIPAHGAAAAGGGGRDVAASSGAAASDAAAPCAVVAAADGQDGAGGGAASASEEDAGERNEPKVGDEGLRRSTRQRKRRRASNEPDSPPPSPARGVDLEAGKEPGAASPDPSGRDQVKKPKQKQQKGGRPGAQEHSPARPQQQQPQQSPLGYREGQQQRPSGGTQQPQQRRQGQGQGDSPGSQPQRPQKQQQRPSGSDGGAERLPSQHAPYFTRPPPRFLPKASVAQATMSVAQRLPSPPPPSLEPRAPPSQHYRRNSLPPPPPPAVPPAVQLHLQQMRRQVQAQSPSRYGSGDLGGGHPYGSQPHPSCLGEFGRDVGRYERGPDREPPSDGYGAMRPGRPPSFGAGAGAGADGAPRYPYPGQHSQHAPPPGRFPPRGDGGGGSRGWGDGGGGGGGWGYGPSRGPH